MIRDVLTEDFQMQVGELVTRNKSLLDILTKLQDAESRVNRAVAKAVTGCGCIGLSAKKQSFPKDAELRSMGRYTETHIDGELCDQCREIVEQELGKLQFYVASLCNTLDLSFYDVLLKEQSRLGTLGHFHMR